MQWWYCIHYIKNSLDIISLQKILDLFIFTVFSLKYYFFLCLIQFFNFMQLVLAELTMQWVIVSITFIMVYKYKYCATKWWRTKTSQCVRHNCTLCAAPPKVKALIVEVHTSCTIHVPMAAVTWLKYCRYGVKRYPINQSMYQWYIDNHWIYELFRCNTALFFNVERKMRDMILKD